MHFDRQTLYSCQQLPHPVLSDLGFAAASLQQHAPVMAHQQHFSRHIRTQQATFYVLTAASDGIHNMLQRRMSELPGSFTRDALAGLA